MHDLIALSITVIVGLAGLYLAFTAEARKKGRFVIAITTLIVVSAYVTYVATYPFDTLRKMQEKYRDVQEELSKFSPQSPILERDAMPNSGDSLLAPVNLRLARFEERHPIIDKTLFVGRSFNDFVFGGKNFHLVRLAARTEEGTDAIIRRPPSAKFIAVQYWFRPFIEFEFKGMYFSIEVRVSDLDPVCTVRQITSPTMDLKSP